MVSTFPVLIFRPPLPTRFCRELQESAEQDVQQDSLDERYLTYSALPDLSDSPWTHRRANINSYEDLDVCPALEAASESSTAKVLKLQLDSQVDPIVGYPYSAYVGICYPGVSAP